MSHHPIIDGSATELPPPSPSTSPSPAKTRSRRGLAAALVAVPLALGAAGLSLAQSGGAPVAPVAASAIASFAPSGPVAAKGEVAEVFGNKFVVQDGTGRALVETGPRGEGGGLVKVGDTVTVQGRFEHGFLHAALITRPDGSQVVLGPAGGPPPGALGWVKDKVGLGPKLDVPAMTASVERAGYSDIRVIGTGPRHVDVAATDKDGRERQLHVEADGTFRERRSF